MRRAVLLAVLVVLAGCNAPLADGTPTDAVGSSPGGTASADGDRGQTERTTTRTPSSDASPTPTPRNSPTPPTSPTPSSPTALAETYEFEPSSELPFDARLVFARTAFLLDRPGVEPPARVSVQSRSDLRFPTRYSDFAATLRIAPPPDAAVLPAFTSGRTITFSAGLADRPAFAEATFAQESAHVAQFAAGADRTLRTRVVSGTRPTVDEAQTIRAMIEGPAVYTEAVYQRRYLDRSRTRIDSLRTAYRNASGVGRAGYGLYYFGARYVDRRVDDPAETWALYDDPPETTEQLLHGGRDPVAALSVDATTAGGYEERDRARTTMGELFLRTTLGTNLSASVAARGADGWGADERLAFVTSENRRPSAYAWVHRWDDPTNATEFETVIARYLNETATRRAGRLDGEPRVVWAAGDDRYRLVRVAPETTVLLLGDPAFVRNATVAGTNDTVTVDVAAGSASGRFVRPTESVASNAAAAGSATDHTGHPTGAGTPTGTVPTTDHIGRVTDARTPAETGPVIRATDTGTSKLIGRTHHTASAMTPSASSAWRESSQATSAGTPKTIARPSRATTAPTAASRASISCIGLVTRS